MDRLLAHRTLGDMPREELAWILARGELRTYSPGAVVSPKGVMAKSMMIVLRGHIVIRADRGAGSLKVFEWREGDVAGGLPYSRGGKPPGDGVAEEETESFELPRERFPEMIRECPAVTTRLVHVMLDRARAFTSSDLRDEKLISLGKLAAGLAHELNNPAAAARRAARVLAESQVAADDAARRLGAARLDEAQLAALDVVRERCRGRDEGLVRSALERSDREEAIGEWLTAHGAGIACAAPLAGTAMTLQDLDTLADAIPGTALDAALQWLAASCSVRSLAGAVETSAVRISELVTAVKGFTFMDHAPTVEPVDIRRGIADAITMLGAKVRAKGAEVSVDHAPDLPLALAVGAELNQVWLNLLDNALDAIAPRGSVRIESRHELGRVVVEVIDNGAGIPAESLWRIFEPFYTTKQVGQGTGLGLDIVRRLLQRQDGGIEAESGLGRTVFRVWLPATDAGGAAEGGAAEPRPQRASAMIGPHSD
jgi:signal transduction histidine kinase